MGLIIGFIIYSRARLSVDEFCRSVRNCAKMMRDYFMVPFLEIPATRFLQNQPLACLIRFISKPKLSELILVFSLRSLRFVKNALRKEGDSNPRYISVNTLSKRARSATLPSFLLKKIPPDFQRTGRKDTNMFEVLNYCFTNLIVPE